ncbi:hypothetical protein K461DRAFT_292709 [Myriangium duriaei CBS 260.36]|uniref:Uncharacterized protein n=1 Tax=Myriangium duriaei CBS 260.36 TaxID=1168546 RepID=A0A9P4J4M8_9PEZI|nr:hypothetical protein K461DRAFT_292709 [Myriangium duriaei CBS 260.36]
MSDASEETPSASAAGGFATTSWSVSDAAGLLSIQMPAKRVVRAWDRQPHIPHASSGAISRAGQGTRKVWRRVRMPTFGSSAGELARSFISSTGPWGAKGMSPKKAVKKLCMQNEFGREWKMTEWDGVKGGHARKAVSRPPIVLRSGTVIDPDFVVDEPTKHQGPGSEDNETEEEDEILEVKEEQQPNFGGEESSPDANACDLTPENEWEDVDSEDDADAHDEDPEMQAEESHPHVLDESAFFNLQAERATQATQATQPLDADNKEDISPTNEAVDSPFSELDVTSPIKPAVEIPALQIPPQTGRSTSAPPTETAAKEERPRPRISDDTAILHAFLSRAAASKKPTIARRESLTNRRDSGMVRQALASPAKPEVLAELDTNSPLPQKAARPEAGEESSESLAATEKPRLPCKVIDEQEDEKPARRSSRSRVKPSLLLDQITAPAKAAPNKITIRGPMDAVPLKRSEVQELAAQTRSNTRKNKGQSVMPLVRLSKLAGEPLVDEDKVETDSESNGQGKNVRWDETLEYFSKAPEEASEADPSSNGSQEEQANEAPSSPNKSRSSRRAKIVKPDTPTPVSQDEAGQAPAASSKPAPAKRRSRIATPAKGLLSRAALLPDDVMSDTPPAEAAPTPVPSKKPPTRSLPTPKRTTTTPVQAQPKALPAAAPQPAALASPEKKPAQPKLHGIPVFAPRLDTSRSLPMPSLSFEDALARDASAPPASRRSVARSVGQEAPGLSSPAKRRRRMAPQGKDEEAGPMVGLSSPAKRRRGVVI